MSEEVIGTHTGKSYNIIGKQHRHYQCVNCRKQVHCVAGYENEGDPVELLKDRCGKDCECKCKTHYLGKDGKLEPYGNILINISNCFACRCFGTDIFTIQKNGKCG